MLDVSYDDRHDVTHGLSKLDMESLEVSSQAWAGTNGAVVGAALPFVADFDKPSLLESSHP